MTTVEESVTETREDIPLKKGKKLRNWYSCNEDSFSGFRFVIVAFGSLTCVITVALLLQIYYGDYQIIPHGSVSTDSLECSKIGTSILKQGGNAVDAAIASAFCLAVTTPHVTGLDAEGQLLIYNHRTRLPPNVIDFTGSLTVPENIPRLVLGLAYVHQQYGSLAWKDLVQPAADLAERGYLISKLLVEAVTKSKAEDLYGRLEAGQILKHENLSISLYKIANIAEDELYTYIQQKQPVLSQALKFTFSNYDIYIPNAPLIGPSLISNLKEIEKFNFTKVDSIKPEYVYRLVEMTQNTYAEQNIKDRFHEGTSSNVAVVDLNDYYVSLVTGMYGLFGSGEMTTHGYVLDVPNKDKPCSRIPLIITDGNFICGRRMVLGANNFATATQLVATLLIAEKNVTEGIESPRFHILGNETIGVEDHLPAFGEDVLEYMKTLSPDIQPISEPYPSSNIVEKTKDELSSHSDSRGGGIASRF
ncbi:glutathione hydrolase 7-like [Anoplophora glabripennis]|uniref:glutathione hydrolase 7-like n=1 Tax=Anoplophora glabripennis TaxID=217634 RepID=UPI0008752FD3|nr:glutathione hydrolase 7-like [Anoplophora glabripennis]